MTNNIHVGSLKEAWATADKLFPSDYCKHDMASEKAGYPVYMTTCPADGHENDHICDLGTRLELNIGADSTNIWIDQNKDIQVILTTKSGSVKIYETYEDFIQEYRFWMASGKQCDSEKDFQKVIDALRMVDMDQAVFQFERDGLMMQFKLEKWA